MSEDGLMIIPDEPEDSNIGEVSRMAYKECIRQLKAIDSFDNPFEYGEVVLDIVRRSDLSYVFAPGGIVANEGLLQDERFIISGVQLPGFTWCWTLNHPESMAIEFARLTLEKVFDMKEIVPREPRKWNLVEMQAWEAYTAIMENGISNYMLQLIFEDKQHVLETFRVWEFPISKTENMYVNLMRLVFDRIAAVDSSGF